ncbi:MAG: HEAT repeat domain-containing protein [Acidimicrobiia bacterium]|nr:HEAT repeat domain-containing protein [Acidimicrobiia bacterium]
MGVASSPQERVEQACDRWGDDEVVARCAALLALGPDDVPTAPGAELAMTLGGLTDESWLATGKPPGHAYWARVWAARALLYVWSSNATSAVLVALDDDHWRVREMAARVVTRRELAEAAELVAARTSDGSPRVRAASATALGVIGEGEHAGVLHALLDDPDAAVARRAAAVLETLRRRLDRAL